MLVRFLVSLWFPLGFPWKREVPLDVSRLNGGAFWGVLPRLLGATLVRTVGYTHVTGAALSKFKLALLTDQFGRHGVARINANRVP